MGDFKDTLLIANGNVPKSSFLMRYSRDFGHIVCCDGAVEKLIECGLSPDIVIGDMDSISEGAIEKLGDTLVKVGDQNSNDLSKGLDWIERQGMKSVTILGADGLREDHELGNILMLLESTYNLEIRMETEYGRFDLMNQATSVDGVQTRNFSCFPGQSVSIFAIDRELILNSDGLEFSLRDFVFEKLNSASLNRATGNNFTIKANHANSNILVYRANEENS